GRLHLNLTQLEHDLLRVRLLASPHVQLLWSWLILSISPVQSQPVRPVAALDEAGSLARGYPGWMLARSGAAQV
ncbi:hypothetical protein MKK64_03620, partial [Methylobacterium sp. E-025]|uniref:hypothetical protein n=1 Tax=Methylobacterium sp. E-025 TaxID=2836561 RepID=UPI001FBB2D0C